MTLTCAAPDATLGVAVRLSTYMDCQARALGENGFQAFAGGPFMAGLLSGLITIFVALIGYRLILGQTPDIRDGVGWAARVGIVLTLATSWPAFQTLVYRVAADAPGELAIVLLPASGLPSDGLDARVQSAYDTMRLGSIAAQGTSPPPITPVQSGQPLTPVPQLQAAPSGITQPPLPQTASVFVIATTGVMGAFRIAIGFLLAIAPLAIMALLFDATLGVFSGWVRALAGAALALLAATIVTAVDLVAVENELANLQAYAGGSISEAVDPQALTTIVLLFAVVMLVAVLAALRMAGAFRLSLPSLARAVVNERANHPITGATATVLQAAQATGGRAVMSQGQTRVAAVADALALTVRREQGMTNLIATGVGAPEAPSRRLSITEAASRSDAGAGAVPVGVAGRRSTGRRTRSAAARDRTK